MTSLPLVICAIAGESDSHTLYFESSYNWTGLLVEPTWSDVLSSKNRKAVSVFNCLSVKAEAHYVDFEMTSALRNREVATMAGIVKVCLPTFSLTDSVSTLLSAGEDRDQHHPPVSASLLSPPGSGQSHRQLVHPRHRGGRVPGPPDHPLALSGHRDGQRGDRPGRPGDAGQQGGDHPVHGVPGIPPQVTDL